jgi:hypothetical protein
MPRSWNMAPQGQPMLPDVADPVVPSRAVASSPLLELVFISIASYGVASAEENFVTEQSKHRVEKCTLRLIVSREIARW